MKMFVISSVFAVIVAYGAYSILAGSGMDSASVYSSANVRQ